MNYDALCKKFKVGLDKLTQNGITNISIVNEYLKFVSSYVPNPETWDCDLYNVLIGVKPVALLDNDCYLANNYKTGDCRLRLFCQLYGMERVTFFRNDDPTNLYYWRSDWKNAALIYKLEEEKTYLYGFNGGIYQSILLGYTKEETRLYFYEIENDEDFMFDWDYAIYTIENNKKELTNEDKLFFRGI